MERGLKEDPNAIEVSKLKKQIVPTTDIFKYIYVQLHGCGWPRVWGPLLVAGLRPYFSRTRSSPQAPVKLCFWAMSSITTHNTPQQIILPHFSRSFFCLCKLFAPTASQGSELSCLTPDRVKWLTSSQSADCSSPVTPFTYFMQQSKSFFTSPPDFKRSQSFPLASRTHLPSPVLHLEKQEAYPATPGFFCINAYSACRLHSSAPKLDSKDVQAENSPALDQGNL